MRGDSSPFARRTIPSSSSSRCVPPSSSAAAPSTRSASHSPPPAPHPQQACCNATISVFLAMMDASLLCILLFSIAAATTPVATCIYESTRVNTQNTLTPPRLKSLLIRETRRKRSTPSKHKIMSVEEWQDTFWRNAHKVTIWIFSCSSCFHRGTLGPSQCVLVCLLEFSTYPCWLCRRGGNTRTA